MPPSPSRFSRLRWLHTFASFLAIVGACMLIGMGLVDIDGSSARVWLVVAGAFVLFLAIVLMTLMPVLGKIESTVIRNLDEARDMRETLVASLARLDAIAENTRLSDAAKSLAHRDQEINTLRAAIREEIRCQNWESGIDLIQEIEKRFGYKHEASSLRSELEEARGVAIGDKLNEAIQVIKSHFDAHAWVLAKSEIDRVLNALPGNKQVLELAERIDGLKEKHKNELHAAWAEAVKRNDVDRAIDVLRELDQYLTAEEASALQASARGVFKEKLLQLGVQFRFAVNEKRWQDALSSGLELVREFPNARMASEVRGVLDTLRERARAEGQSEAAGV